MRHPSLLWGIIGFFFLSLSACQKSGTLDETLPLSLSETSQTLEPSQAFYLFCKDPINSSSLSSFHIDLRADTPPTRIYFLPLLDLSAFQWISGSRVSSEVYFEAAELNLTPGSGPPQRRAIFRSQINFSSRKHQTQKLLSLPLPSTSHRSSFTVLETLSQIVAPWGDHYGRYDLTDSKPKIEFPCPWKECFEPRAHSNLEILALTQAKQLRFFHLRTGQSLDPFAPVPLTHESHLHGFQWIGSWGSVWMDSTADQHFLVFWSGVDHGTFRIPLPNDLKLAPLPVFFAETTRCNEIILWIDTLDTIVSLRVDPLKGSWNWETSLLKPRSAFSTEIGSFGSRIVTLLPQSGRNSLWIGLPWQELHQVDCDRFSNFMDSKRF